MKKIFLLILFLFPVLSFAQTPADDCIGQNKNYSAISACMVRAGLCDAVSGVGTRFTCGKASPRGTCPQGFVCTGIGQGIAPGTIIDYGCKTTDDKVLGYCPIPAGASGGLGGGRDIGASEDEDARSEDTMPCPNPAVAPTALSAAPSSAAASAVARAMRLAASAPAVRSSAASFGRSVAVPAVRVNLPRMRCGRTGSVPYTCPSATPSCCNDAIATNGGYIGTCVAPYAACPPPRRNPPPPPPPVCSPACSVGTEACISCLDLDDLKTKTTCVSRTSTTVSKICP